MKNLFFILSLALFSGCGFVGSLKYNVSQSLIRQAIKLSPTIADSSFREISFQLPDIIINKQGIIEGMSDTIILTDTFTETITEIRLEVMDSNCVGKVFYNTTVIRDSVFFPVKYPVIQLDTSKWKVPYFKALKEAKKYEEKSKKRLKIIIILILTILALIYFYFKYVNYLKNEKEI